MIFFQQWKQFSFSQFFGSSVEGYVFLKAIFKGFLVCVVFSVKIIMIKEKEKERKNIDKSACNITGIKISESSIRYWSLCFFNKVTMEVLMSSFLIGHQQLSLLITCDLLNSHLMVALGRRNHFLKFSESSSWELLLSLKSRLSTGNHTTVLSCEWAQQRRGPQNQNKRPKLNSRPLQSSFQKSVNTQPDSKFFFLLLFFK